MYNKDLVVNIQLLSHLRTMYTIPVKFDLQTSWPNYYPFDAMFRFFFLVF